MPEKRSILIYTPRITNRHKYVFGFLQGFFDDIATIAATTEKSVFLAHRDISINYSNEDIGAGTLKITPSGLLEKETLATVEAATGRRDGVIVLFPNADTALSFDIFGAIFYLLSRFEEYQPYVPDIHGRFPAECSLLYKCNSLQVPVIDYWLLWLEKELFGSVRILAPRTELTMDVDHPFKIYGKPAFKKLGLLLKGDVSLKQVFSHADDDPFNTFAYFRQIAAGYSPVVFFLINNVGPNNSSTDIRNAEYRRIIKEMAEFCEVGLHNSYASFDNTEMLKAEKQVLEDITQSPVRSIRQHFLRFRVSEYYSRLAGIGIENDHSMGFSSQPGFRAGTSRSFYWYDLVNERVTSLRIHPFCWMDATFTYYKAKDDNGVLLELTALYDHIEKTGGVFRGLIHNDHLSEPSPYNDWRQITTLLNSYKGR